MDKSRKNIIKDLIGLGFRWKYIGIYTMEFNGLYLGIAFNKKTSTANIIATTSNFSTHEIEVKDRDVVTFVKGLMYFANSKTQYGLGKQ